MKRAGITIVTLVLMCGCLALCSNCRLFAGSAKPANQQIASANTGVDSNRVALAPSDGDDDADELLYHWQNTKYIRDEHRGIAYATIFLSIVAVGSILKGRRRPCLPNS